MTKLPPLANFVSRRINELAPVRSQKEIAAMAGFSSPNVISMLKTGTTKLALERVESLATALNCDPRVLMRLALEQFYEASVVEQIIRCAEPRISADEFQFVNSLRNIIATAK